MKIVFCTDTIFQLGGIEIVTINKANALAQIPGNQVWIIVADNKYSAITLLKNVSVIDLAVHFYEHDNKRYLYAVMDVFRKKRIYRQRTEAILSDIQPDVVISTGLLSRHFLPHLHISSHPVFIREIHHARHNYLREATTWVGKLQARLSMWYDYGWNIKRYDKIVVLTPEGKSGSWQHWDKVAIIPNPLTNESEEYAISTGDAKVAIAVGRLVDVKNFSSLIRIWAKVTKIHPDWTLQIWGSGPQEHLLRELIIKMDLKDCVLLMGYTKHVFHQMSQASIHLVSSRSEGFSIVTLESMSVGIPTIGYNCPGGLKYLVQDGVTGILVPLYDEDTFVKQVCYLIEHPKERKALGKAGLDASENYRVEKIAQQWMDLFLELRNKNHKSIETSSQ